MKFRSFLIVIIILTNQFSLNAQLKVPSLDISPMDMTYFPNGYTGAIARGTDPGKLTMRIIYSRPQKKGREIFGKLVEYSKWWRMGANEATELDVFEPITIGGKKLEKGRYTLSCIPNENTWTIIVSSQTDIWGEGSNKYDPKNDIVRLDVTIETLTEDVEAFSMGFMKTEKGANILIAWEKVKVLLPVTF